MTTARPQKRQTTNDKRHLFVYIAQRTLLKIFKRVRDEARKNILKKVKYFSCIC